MKEGTLHKGVSFFGNLIERVVGKAKKAKEGYEKRTGIPLLLSLESRLSLPKLKQLIDLLSERFIPPAIPAVMDKTILEMGEGSLKFRKQILERKPKVFCGVVIGETGKTPPVESSLPFILKGSFKSIPFEDQFFDCVVCRLASPLQGDVITVFKEVGRVLVPEGEALFLDYHPFGLYSKGGAERLRSVQSTIRGVEDYFKMCKVAGLSIVDIHEGFVDDTLRNQFTTPEEMSAFREIKGTPLVLFLKVVKPRKKI